MKTYICVQIILDTKIDCSFVNYNISNFILRVKAKNEKDAIKIFNEETKNEFINKKRFDVECFELKSIQKIKKL